MYNGTPDKTNTPSPYLAPGELGCSFSDQNTGGVYVRVQVDSGATSTSGIGHSPLAGELAYWKNAAPGVAIVTNDKFQCDLGATAAPNRIAGVFQLAPTVTPGVNGPDGNPQMYMTDLVIQKRNTPVLCSSTPTAGEFLTGNTAANTANTVANAVGTAAPTTLVGVATGVANTGTANSFFCDVNVGFQD